MTTPLLHARPAAVSERARTHNLLLLPDPQGSLPTLAPDRDPLQRLHHVLLLPGSQGEVTINGGNSSVGSPAAALLQQPFHVTHQQRGGKRGEQPLGPPCRRVFFESDCHPPRESVSSVLRTKKEKKIQLAHLRRNTAVGRKRKVLGNGEEIRRWCHWNLIFHWRDGYTGRPPVGCGTGEAGSRVVPWYIGTPASPPLVKVVVGRRAVVLGRWPSGFVSSG